MNDNMINDVRVPVFALAVFYAGLFFILAPSVDKNRVGSGERNKS